MNPWIDRSRCRRTSLSFTYIIVSSESTCLNSWLVSLSINRDDRLTYLHSRIVCLVRSTKFRASCCRTPSYRNITSPFELLYFLSLFFHLLIKSCIADNKAFGVDECCPLFTLSTSVTTWRFDFLLLCRSASDRFVILPGGIFLNELS